MKNSGTFFAALLWAGFSLPWVGNLYAQDFESLANLLGAHEKSYASDMKNLPDGEFLERARLISDFLDSKPSGATAESATYKEKRQGYLAMLASNKGRFLAIASRQPADYMTEKARWLARRVDGYLPKRSGVSSQPGGIGISQGVAVVPPKGLAAVDSNKREGGTGSIGGMFGSGSSGSKANKKD